MIETADVVVVGAGVQGASLAFHLARRGASVVVVERETVAAGATGRSSGFVRMHYDLESEMRLAWLSFPYFRSWAEHVGAGDPGFVRTGFLHAMPEALAAAMRANIAVEQGLGVPVQAVDPAEIARLVPGAVTDGLAVGAYEPESGYADPSGTAAGFLAAARRLGTRLVQGSRVRSIAVEGDAVSGVDTDRGRIAAPVVAIAVGAWAADLARTAGVELPVQPWRHETAYFGLPAGHGPDFPIVIDEVNGVYFRPEGGDLMLVGLEGRNEVGGSPDRPLDTAAPADHRGHGPAGLRARPLDDRGHVPHGPRRPGRDHARPAPDPRARRSGRPVRRVRVLRHRLQDGPGHRRLPGRADPRRPHDDRRHLGLRPRPVRGGPPARRRALVWGALALSRGRGQRDQRRRPLARSAAGAGPGSAR